MYGMHGMQVVTRGSQCRVAEDPALIAGEDVGVPDYFISHAWRNRFDLLLRSVEGFLSSAAEETRVWIDILAVNQHSGNPHQARDVAAFKVRGAGWGSPLTRGRTASTWCRCGPRVRMWGAVRVRRQERVWAACMAT